MGRLCGRIESRTRETNVTETEKQTILDALAEAKYANTNLTGRMESRFDALQDVLEARWGMESA